MRKVGGPRLTELKTYDPFFNGNYREPSKAYKPLPCPYFIRRIRFADHRGPGGPRAIAPTAAPAAAPGEAGDVSAARSEPAAVS
eukprot:4714284-Heterocapsa_arctica.AAC.1